ncbi:hypothetical protein NLU13_7270 [Sarocladium strictum]|uniref:Proteophosphoglycan 5 n=1 Tax=Sarocladium strictum TaxID=5046 RepID=A0AA39GEW0_SARSR|nr:hypothetical protein NLU13_7270 [Sarocladium strictum]
MSEVSIPPKATPGRRRNGRGQPKAAAPKAYASENDATAVDSPRLYDSPQTPVKNSSASAARNNAPNSQTNNKTRSRTKNKPKPSTSPDPGATAQATTPQRPASMSTTKPNMAFAGATFHASPAPSALPMPSFFTKSSNESPIPRSSINPAQQPSPPATDPELPTPNRTASAPQNNGSPLDFMFRAHREEKERERRGSTLSQKPAMNSGPSPFQSSANQPALREASSVPHTRNPIVRQHSSGRIDSKELDGERGLPMGPAFSTPYQDRIRAARANQTRSNLTEPLSPPQPKESESLDDRSEALKKFLFGGGFSNDSPPNPSSVTSNNFNLPPHASPTVGSYSPVSYQNMPSSQPQSSGRPNDIQAMENDLRRILKLNPASQSGANSGGLF